MLSSKINDGFPKPGRARLAVMRQGEGIRVRFLFRGPVPHCVDLYCVAALIDQGDFVASATGLAPSLAEATDRCKNEISEHLALLTAKPSGMFGIAAAATRKLARARASAELVERHAVQRWWYRGFPAYAPTNAAIAGLEIAQSKWPRHAKRSTTLLDISCDKVNTVLVAWSCDDYGRDLQFGFSCGVDLEEVAQSAYRELIQMEFGAQVIAHRAGANIPLSRPDRIRRARARRLVRRACAPIGIPPICISTDSLYQTLPSPPEIALIDMQTSAEQPHVSVAQFSDENECLEPTIQSGYTPPGWDVF